MNFSTLRPTRTALIALGIAWLAHTSYSAQGGAADTQHLTDEPGNWFSSETTGTPVSVIDMGDRVDFKINNCCTSTRHTVTLLLRPEGSGLTLDQDSSQKGTLSATFDVPGVYLIVCKIHPYMTSVVAVLDENGAIPDVTSGALPFLEHLGVATLPATQVLDVITTIAPDDAAKAAKWDILTKADEVLPQVPGVGEVWINSQFERVPGQLDLSGVQKPGTITVVDAASFQVEREINGLGANGQWNNPHNMWADFTLSHVYNSNWFGRWINKIERESGQIVSSTEVGEAPTHIITIPFAGMQKGWLTIPLSADNDLVKVEDGPGGLHQIDKDPTGAGKTHPHGHWLTCGEGDRAVVPNVFNGVGVAGSVSVMDTASGDVLAEFTHDPTDPIRSALLMPIAVGECHVDGVSTAYIANAVSGMVTVLDVDSLSLIGNIPVTLTPDGKSGLDLFHTLQVPIQTPVSPDEHWVATAVLSLTTVPRTNTGSPDHVAIIDTHTNQVVKYVPTPAGTHGVNWGAKLGGGYYAYVTNQHANVLTVIDPDPDGDGSASDAAAVGTILLANGSSGAGITDGTGGQGVKPLPMAHDGWMQETVVLAGTGALSNEVEGWISQLTFYQSDPSKHAPRVYCTAKVNSKGCRTLIGFSGVPSASAGTGFTVSAHEVLNNVTGLLFYGTNDEAAIPFQGGLLCVAPPVTRTPGQSSGGTSPPVQDCSGAFALDFNTFAAGGFDPTLTAGKEVWAQYWSRDPGFAPPDNTNLSNALEFTLEP